MAPDAWFELFNRKNLIVKLGKSDTNFSDLGVFRINISYAVQCYLIALF